MDKEAYRKTEGLLYGHYRDINRLKSLEIHIQTIKDTIDKIDNKIKECDVKVDYYQSGIEITEKVQTSSQGLSYAEKEIIKGIDSLEREKAHNIRKLFKLECTERNLRNKIKKIESNINMLNEEYKKFIQLKYNKELRVREVAIEMNMSKNAAYSLKDKIIESIYSYTWIF